MMGLIKRKKRDDSELAETTTSTNLFKADHAKLEQIRKRGSKRPAEFFREFVHQALIQQELVERQSPAAVAVDSVAINGLLRENLAPILQELQDVKGCMQELASMRVEPPSTGSGPDAAFALEHHVKETNRCLSEIFHQVEDRCSDYVRIAQLLHDRQERAERWSQGAYVLAGHSFNAMSAILDLLQRYVVVPQLKAMDPEADALTIIKAENEASCAAAVTKRKSLERRLNLPKDGKVKFLSRQLPEPRRDAA